MLNLYYIYLCSVYLLLFLSNQSYEITRCRGRIVLNEKDECVKSTEHSHMPDPRNFGKNSILDAIKKESKINKENARNIIAKACDGQAGPVLARLPNIPLITRTIQRVRGSISNISNPKSLLELEFDDESKKLANGDNFLLYDSGPREDRIVIFGTRKNLSILSQCEFISMDGTFNIAPMLFEQLYTIHGMV